jgi:bifunctional non-homologous end joining protein LigD
LAARGTPATASKKKPLAEYARKRDFSRTPEPKGKVTEDSGGAFVVQQHDARRLHFDLRLELDGVLKSWAVTRGPSLTLGEKRLAVRTEDHPVEYLDFEGNIPEGEYGGGSMIVWDRGRWRPEGDPRKGLAKGHLAFALEGSRLKGRWHLVRMRPKPGEKSEPWLLIKSEDEFARQPGDPEITDEETTSYVSGRTNADLAAAGDMRSDHKARAKEAEQRNRFPISGRSPREEESCRRSSSPPSPHCARSRRAGRNGCMRSSMTAIACRRASMERRSSSSHASRWIGQSASTGLPKRLPSFISVLR